MWGKSSNQQSCIIIPTLLLCWIVLAQPGRVIDGDTFDARVKAYPKVDVSERIRVLDLNTPERGQTNYNEAKAFTAEWLASGDVTLAINCSGAPAYDSFGRVLATVTRDGASLADALIAKGLGVRFP